MPARMIAALAAALLFALPLSGASAQDKPRATDGTIMDLSKWHAIPAHEFMLNIIDLPDVKLSRAERRMRDNHIPQERIYFDRGKGGIFVEHVSVGLYNSRVTGRMKSRDRMEELVEQFVRPRGSAFTIEQDRKIYRYGDRGGWFFETRGKTVPTVCIVGRFGFISRGKQTTDERYDTSVSFRDCSGKRSLDDVLGWVKGAKIVEPPYNRVR